MGILTNNKLFKQKFNEAKDMTQEELFECNMGYIKVLQKAPFGEKIVCSFCKNNFKAFKLDAELGLEARKYMHNICGNPCKKHFKYDQEKNIIEKVL